MYFYWLIDWLIDFGLWCKQSFTCFLVSVLVPVSLRVFSGFVWWIFIYVLTRWTYTFTLCGFLIIVWQLLFFCPRLTWVVLIFMICRTVSLFNCMLTVSCNSCRVLTSQGFIITSTSCPFYVFRNHYQSVQCLTTVAVQLGHTCRTHFWTKERDPHATGTPTQGVWIVSQTLCQLG